MISRFFKKKHVHCTTSTVQCTTGMRVIVKAVQCTVNHLKYCTLYANFVGIVVHCTGSWLIYSNLQYNVHKFLYIFTRDHILYNSLFLYVQNLENHMNLLYNVQEFLLFEALFCTLYRFLLYTFFSYPSGHLSDPQTATTNDLCVQFVSEAIKGPQAPQQLSSVLLYVAQK